MNIQDLTILAVEDQEFQRIVLTRMLADLGAGQVYVAVDGSSALAILADGDVRIDVVISDIDMPGMDGMEFMRHLGASKRPLSIILASALDSTLLASVETMTRAYGVNILGTIEKPITPARLEAILKRHERPSSDAGHAGSPGRSFTVGEILLGVQEDQFEPFFQPKVELATGRLRGSEALARWRHPEAGIVAPFAFIQALEDASRIDELTWVILRKAAEACARTRVSSGVDLTVAVNLSITSLADVHLAERVTDIVRGAALDPKYVILEVTESATTTEVGRVLENLSRLRMKGFGLSIDDYGTGYSSMQQLTRIAFTELKIDQSFVASAPRTLSSRVILESSIDMALKLGLTSVAEGIESQLHLDLLRRLGCQVGQGYFIARPMEGAAFERWIDDRSPSEGRPRYRAADSAIG